MGLFALDPDWVTSPVLDAYVHSALDNSLYLNVGRVPFNPAGAPGFQVSWTPGGCEPINPAADQSTNRR